MTEEKKLQLKVKRQESTIKQLRDGIKDLQSQVQLLSNAQDNDTERWNNARRALAEFLYSGQDFEQAVVSVMRDRLNINLFAR